MNTGTCVRPSWTAIVCPTISGKTVDARDQVRIIRFSFAAFIASIRVSRRSSTYGPFFDERLKSASPRLRAAAAHACSALPFVAAAAAADDQLVRLLVV